MKKDIYVYSPRKEYIEVVPRKRHRSRYVEVTRIDIFERIHNGLTGIFVDPTTHQLWDTRDYISGKTDYVSVYTPNGRLLGHSYNVSPNNELYISTRKTKTGLTVEQTLEEFPRTMVVVRNDDKLEAIFKGDEVLKEEYIKYLSAPVSHLKYDPYVDHYVAYVML